MVKNIVNKAFAFTLAETLIVMGIIGVVAALTIPNLNSSTAGKEKVAKLQKIYSNLEDAFGRATAVYGPIEDWCHNISGLQEHNACVAERFTEFMKISKNCKFTIGSGCWVNKDVNYLDGTSSWGPGTSDDSYKFIMADGTALAFDIIWQNGCTSGFSYSNGGGTVSNKCTTIYIDLDGIKGANTDGKDFFEFYVTKDGIVPEVASNVNDAALKASCFKFGGCSGWVLANGNMDYLKADRTGKCPNGKQLSWTNTSCK